METKLIEYTCRKCGHTWVPRVPDPELCPKCKSRQWNVEVKDVKKPKR